MNSKHPTLIPSLSYLCYNDEVRCKVLPMPQLAELIEQIEELDPVEYEVLLHSLKSRRPDLDSQMTTMMHQDYPTIVSTPLVCGGAARFIRTRIPVWTVERMRQLGISESDILRSYPTLRAADLVQAWSYAEQHRTAIEQAILENEMD